MINCDVRERPYVIPTTIRIVSIYDTTHIYINVLRSQTIRIQLMCVVYASFYSFASRLSAFCFEQIAHWQAVCHWEIIDNVISHLVETIRQDQLKILFNFSGRRDVVYGHFFFRVHSSIYLAIVKSDSILAPLAHLNYWSFNWIERWNFLFVIPQREIALISYMLYMCNWLQKRLNKKNTNDGFYMLWAVRPACCVYNIYMELYYYKRI